MGSLLNMSGRALVKMPYDAEVEYLESSGMQCINTGITPTLSYSVEIEFKWVSPYNTTNDASGTLFGTFNGWNNEAFMFVGAFNTTRLFNCWGNKNTYNNNSSYIAGLADNWHALTFRNKITYIDGTAIAGASSGKGNPVGAVYLFCARTYARDTDYGIYGIGTTKQIRKFKMFDGNMNVVSNFIPVRVGNVGYMYDKVSGQLFGNAGAGSFILGPDKIN